jgi:EAL domain-containing protein (putative c-di-GMP-specific phosphodiesterase class I)
LLSNQQFDNFLPFLLRGVTVIGVFSIVLILTREGDEAASLRQRRHGEMLCVAGFFVTALLMYPPDSTVSCGAMATILFVVGLLAGARGGAICLGLALLLGWISGHGSDVGLVADLGLGAAAGTVMHVWLRARTLERLRSRDVVFIWLISTLAGLIVPGIRAEFQYPELGVALSTILPRVQWSTISLFVYLAIFFMLRRDRLDRRAHSAQRKSTEVDPLTTLPNRRALERHLDKVAALGETADSAVLLVEVADSLDVVLQVGHDGMDRFWRRLAARLGELRSGENSRAPRVAYFLLNDMTFAAVLERGGSEQVSVTEVLVQLTEEIERCRSLDAVSGQAPKLGCRVVHLHAGDSGAKILRNIGVVQNIAERGGANLALTSGVEAARFEYVHRKLIDWISSRSPPLQYQPKYLLQSGELAGAEALIRATDDAGHPILPSEIIFIAEKSELLAAFEWCTVEAVIRDLSHFHVNGRVIGLSVNLSAVSLAYPGFGGRVVSALRAADVRPCELTIEVVETSRLPDSSVVAENLQALTQAGVRLSLDDFGTGYSDLQMLARFDFHEIKIDRSFVNRLDEPRMRSAVTLACRSAYQYEANLVAEGIETDEQLVTLRELGVQIGQGFLFSAAKPIDALMEISLGFPPLERG